MATFAQSTISPSSTTPLSTLSHSPSDTASSAISFTLLASSVSGSALPTPTDDAPPTTPLSPDGSDNDSQDRDNNLLNFYFIFIALFVILLLICIWFIHRCKKQQKARIRNSGQNALARDLNGWSQPRRWMLGVAPWRTDGPLEAAREEGLNELGEAPPPYIKDTRIGERIAPVEGTTAEEPLVEPAIPLRALSRNEQGRLKPPDYESSIRDSLSPFDDHSRPGSIVPSPSVEDFRASHS